MSKEQDIFQEELKGITDKLNLSLYCENTHKKQNTIVLDGGGKHIVDFQIPELNLFIEYSGNNYLAKLIKMIRAHKLKTINYVSIIEIDNKELGLPKIDLQKRKFLTALESKTDVKELSSVSFERLCKLLANFNGILNKVLIKQ